MGKQDATISVYWVWGGGGGMKAIAQRNNFRCVDNSQEFIHSLRN